MSILTACAVGVILDMIFGDPVWLYHPVRLIGKLISILEYGFRRICRDEDKEKENHRLLIAGRVFCILVPVISAGIPAFILLGVRQFRPEAAFVLECFWCYQLLAARSLKVESRRVYDRLKDHDLPGARKAVSMIVGRDTQALDERGVTKAAVETVAENTSDGVTAPLFYMMIGGPILGFFYKAVNTMDSMVGYKNEKYLYFGRAAAKFDDLMNYIPARISAWLMIASAFLLRMDGANAYQIYKRDRRKHASPNAAQTEAVCAGALRVQLAGNAYYFGKLYEKEYIGDDLRPVEAEDILRAGHLMDGTEILMLVMCAVLRYAILAFI